MGKAWPLGRWHIAHGVTQLGVKRCGPDQQHPVVRLYGKSNLSALASSSALSFSDMRVCSAPGGACALPCPASRRRHRTHALPATAYSLPTLQLAQAALSSLSPPALLGLQLSTLAVSTAASLKLLSWASTHAEPLAEAERTLEAEATLLERELETSLALPAGSGRLLHSHLSHPLRTFLLVSTCVAALHATFSALHAPATLFVALTAGWRLLAVACAAWTAVFAQQVAFSRWAAATPANAPALGALRTVTERATGAVALLLALHYAGLPLGPLLALGSVGGLSLGLATQVAASNVVAGACLLLARPYVLNDKIDLPGRAMTGFVTRFGIDSTTLTLDDTTAVTVPNAELAKLAIRNLSRRTHWPVNAQFRLAHGALPGVRALLTDMERYCRNRADFAEMQPRLACRVVLADVSPDALLIAVSTYMSRAGCDQTSFERRRSDILCDLGDMITTHGLKLALPASSVRLDTP